MSYSNGTLACCNAVCRFGQTPDGVGQTPHAVDGEKQCDSQAKRREDHKPQRDHLPGALELLQRIDKIEHNGSQESGRLIPLRWLIHGYGSSHRQARRRHIDLVCLQGAHCGEKRRLCDLLTVAAATATIASVCHSLVGVEDLHRFAPTLVNIPYLRIDRLDAVTPVSK